MTNEQKQKIIEFRKQDYGYSSIASALGLIKNQVSAYCRRNRLSEKNGIKLLTDKESVVADAKKMAALLLDTAAPESERNELLQETQVVSDMVQNCIYENAHVALDQAEYQKRFDELTARFGKAKARPEAVMDEFAKCFRPLVPALFLF